jgi:hypothetical protein
MPYCDDCGEYYDDDQAPLPGWQLLRSKPKFSRIIRTGQHKCKRKPRDDQYGDRLAVGFALMGVDNE